MTAAASQRRAPGPRVSAPRHSTRSGAARPVTGSPSATRSGSRSARAVRARTSRTARRATRAWISRPAT